MLTEAVVARFVGLCGPLDRSRLGLFPTRQCVAASGALEVDGAAISLLVDQGHQVPLGSSGLEATIAERLEFTLGQGPCLDAHTHQRPVLVPDVADPDSCAWATWPVYAAEVLARTRYRAVYALPLSCQGLALGTLNLYRHQPGPLSSRQFGDAHAVASRIFEDLIDSGAFYQAGGAAGHWLRQPLAAARSVVWAAVGMVVVELDLIPTDALALLRAHAYAHNQLLDHLAVDIVNGHLPLDRLHP